MIDDVSDIAAFYNGDPDMEHSRLERHQLEYDMTWRYLEEYLPERGKILEIGAATGRYTLELARRGYDVTAVDLSEGLLEACRKNLAAEGLSERVQFVLADARDLSAVTQRGYDAALLMGPLYHLIEEADRKAALKEAIDRLHNDGILVSAFISRFGVWGDLLKAMPEWIEDQIEVHALLESGKQPDDYPRGRGFRAYFAEVREIAPLHESVGFETLVVAGTEPGISADDASYNALEGLRRQQWLDALYRISREPSSLGASRHLLYIGRKRRE